MGSLGHGAVSAHAVTDAAPERRVVLALVGIVVAVTSSSLWVLALLSAVPLAGLRRAGAFSRLVRRTAALAFIVVPAAVLRAFSTNGERWMGAAGFELTHEGARAAAVLVTRTAVAALWAAWLTETLSARDLERALERLGVPTAIVDLLRLTQRFGRQLATTLSSAWNAAVLRGALESWRARRRVVGLVAGVVLTRGLARAERVALARSLRGEG